jgi:hypothetical protein
MPVSFERDIRPLFRQIDIDHMNKHNVARQLHIYGGCFKRLRQRSRCRGQSDKPIHASRWPLLEQ